MNHKAFLLGCIAFFAASTAAYAENILFVCTGNTGRSPMAEVLANQYFAFPDAGYSAQSRGVRVNPAETLPEANAVTVIDELIEGNTLSEHRANPMTKQDVDQSDLILTMTEAHKIKVLAQFPEAKDKTYTLSECATGKTEDVLDAYHQDIDFYRKTRDQIAHYLYLVKAHQFHCASTMSS